MYSHFDEDHLRAAALGVVLQHVSAMALLLLPVVFLGLRQPLAVFPTTQILASSAIVLLATLAFGITVWIVRCVLLDPHR